MKTSSSRFKALAVTAGFSFWFFIITSAFGIFSIEAFLIFIIILAAVTQIFAVKLSRGLDIFATINTKIFVGMLFIFVISDNGILYKFLIENYYFKGLKINEKALVYLYYRLKCDKITTIYKNIGITLSCLLYTSDAADE